MKIHRMFRARVISNSQVAGVIAGTLAWLKPSNVGEREDVLVWQQDGIQAAERLNGEVVEREAPPPPPPKRGERQVAPAILIIELGSNEWRVYKELPVTAKKVVTKQMALDAMPRARAAGLVTTQKEE